MKSTHLRDALKPILPKAFFDLELLQIDLWQWALLPLLVLAAYFLSWYISKLSLKVSYRVIIGQVPSFDKKILHAAFAPLCFGFTVGLFAIGLRFISLDPDVYGIIASINKLAGTVAITWFVFRVVDVFADWMSERLREKGEISIITMLPLIRRTIKTAVIVLAILTFLQNLGVHVTALIAGLGVGGIAVALAAQKTLENLFGGVMLILDQPIRVGDDCRFGTQQGIVEDIGLRTTRIRTNERTLVSVPNSDFSQMQLENFSARDRIRFAFTLSLQRETTPDQLRFVLIEVRKLLYAHPKIDRDPARVRLSGFGSYSFDIEILAYVLTPHVFEFWAVREDLLLRIIDVVAQSGTHLALPAQTNYAASEQMPDAAKTESAQSTVATWRSSNELPLPEFSDAQIEAIDDTLDYPPKGSALKN